MTALLTQLDARLDEASALAKKLLEASVDPAPIVPTVYVRTGGEPRLARIAVAYSQWCLTGSAPASDPQVSLRHARHAKAETDGVIGGQMRHQVTESKQLAEFVIFAINDTERGYLYPCPDAVFAPVITRVFPSIRQAPDDPRGWADLSPAWVVRNSNGQWDVL